MFWVSAKRTDIQEGDMFAMSSAVIEHELANRRHEQERAAAHTAVLRHHVERDDTAPPKRRFTLAELRRLIPRTL